MIDLQCVTTLDRMRGESDEDSRLLRSMYRDAEEFLASRQWCSSIEERYFGFGVGGVVAIFLFRIVPAGHADEWIWILSGDLPVAYLVAEQASTPIDALEGYIAMMQEWIDAVDSGEGLEDAYPVDAPADSQHAAMLSGRLDFLRREILPLMR
jgi:hypothetical protein